VPLIVPTPCARSDNANYVTSGLPIYLYLACAAPQAPSGAGATSHAPQRILNSVILHHGAGDTCSPGSTKFLNSG